MKNALFNTDFNITLRNFKGEIISKISKKVGDIATASVINVEEEFKDSLTNKIGQGFKASLEIELFFEKTPKFNFPALILNYSDDNNSTYVHSCLRTYNQDEIPVLESFEKNQTGFNVYAEKDLTNYLVFITGAQKKYKFKIIIQNSKEKIVREEMIINKNPYQLIQFNFDEILDLFKEKNDVFKVTIDHNINDVFARFYVGNYKNSQIPTLTHTFFDEHKYPNTVNNNNTNNWDTAFCFPFLDPNKFNNILGSYECNVTWKGLSRFEFLDLKGNSLFHEDLNVDENFSLFKTSFLNINELFNKTNLHYDQVKSFKISFKGNVPIRNKYGLNYSVNGKVSGGSNICFAPKVYNEAFDNKPLSTSWGPLGGLKNIIYYYNNTSLSENLNDKKNIISINFINSEGKMMNKQYELNSDEILKLDVSKNKELDFHFDKKVGWCFLKTDNNYSNSWYFQFGKDMIGGDHAF